MVKVSVIVLNWNGKIFLKTCLDALRQQTYKDFEVILVDNASTDDSVGFVEEFYPEVIVVRNSTNRGFSGGNNDGVKVTKGKIIVLLNNDTKPNIDWLSELIKGFEKLDAGAAFSFVMSKYDDDQHTTRAGARLGATTVLGHAVDIGNAEELIEEGRPIESCFVGGCTMTFRKEIGLPFDEDYFLYSEDIYFSWKQRLQGKKLYLIPSSICYHEGEGSSKNLKTKAFYQQRNRLMNLFVFYQKKTLFKLLPLILFNMAVTGVRNFPYRFIGNLWIFLKFWNIIRKRHQCQALRKVPDSEITPMLSGKFFDGFELLNKLQLAYLRFVGVKTIETSN